MSNTYVGWDGKSYPWPPPEGWYEAIDGRWWALGTGPNPPPQGAGIQSTPADPVRATGPQSHPTTVAGPGAIPVGPHGAPGPQPSDDRTSQLPAYGTDPVGADASPAIAGAAAAAAYQRGQIDPTLAQQPVTPGGPPRTPDTVNYGFDGGPPVNPDDYGQPPSRGGGILRSLLIIVGMVAVALGGGLAYFYLTADDATETAGGDTTDPTTETTIADSPDGTDTTQAPAETSTTQPGDEDGSEVDETTTTLAEPDSPLSRFRSILADNDLASDELPDAEIRAFADSFCGMAAGAADDDDFDDIRDAAVEATNSDLADRDLRLVIDAAVISFCPDEADRLGIDV